MTKEKTIRQEILSKVNRYYKAKFAKAKFMPGVSQIRYAGRVFDQKEMIHLVDAALDFWLTAGRFADKFEKKFANFFGVKHCLLTNSGSSANLLALSALTSPLMGKRKLNPGDEVITTACGFPTTLNPILQNQLLPVFIDIELGTYNIDVKQIERAITKKTKAIFIAHTLGNPANIKEILRIVKKYDLWFIEDNCDALGAKYNGRYTGTFGAIATCSFYPPHHITMGEGGAVITNDSLLNKIILSLRDWGRDCWCAPGKDNTCGQRFSKAFGHLPLGYDHKYVYSHIGYNLKVTDMQAAVGLAQLEKLKSFIAARNKNFQKLKDAFKNYEKFLLLPEATNNAEPSWFGFPIMVKEGVAFSRKDIVHHLEVNKITTRMLFGGNLTKQPAYLNTPKRMVGNLKNTDFVMNNLFWIGVYPGIGKEERKYIFRVMADFFENII